MLIDVYQDNGAIRTTFEIAMDSQTETQSKYDIHAESRYVATGQPVANTDIVFTVLGETGQPFGELESQEDNSRGNPVTGRTNAYGDSGAFLRVTASQLVTIKATILGSVSTATAYVQVGPVQPANLVPFTTISFPGEITDLEMSPTRSALVATSDGGNVARVFDSTTYQSAPGPQPHEGGRCLRCVFRWQLARVWL